MVCNKGIWHRKMCHTNNEKWKKLNKREIKQPNEERVKTLEKKNGKLQLLDNIETETIRQTKMKEKK